MKNLTAQQIQQLDRRTIEAYGIPSVVLMENAGRAVARKIFQDFPKRNLRVVIFCGTGNNGGDGFVVARHLREDGAKVRVFLAGKIRDLKPDAAVNCGILTRLGQRVDEIAVVDRKVLRGIAAADVVVDALFGVGLNRPLNDFFCGLIDALNAGGKPIVAIDLPSGLDATAGTIWGRAVRAQQTVTFTFPKKGFYRNAGPAHAGRITVVDIGIPKAVIRNSSVGTGKRDRR